MDFLQCVALLLKPASFVVGDVIISMGETRKEMYFIQSGTVEVFISSDKGLVNQSALTQALKLRTRSIQPSLMAESEQPNSNYTNEQRRALTEDGLSSKKVKFRSRTEKPPEFLSDTLSTGNWFGQEALLYKTASPETVKVATPCDMFVLTRLDFVRAIAVYPDVEESIVLRLQGAMLTRLEQREFLQRQARMFWSMLRDTFITNRSSWPDIKSCIRILKEGLREVDGAATKKQEAKEARNAKRTKTAQQSNRQRAAVSEQLNRSTNKTNFSNSDMAPKSSPKKLRPDVRIAVPGSISDFDNDIRNVDSLDLISRYTQGVVGFPELNVREYISPSVSKTPKHGTNHGIFGQKSMQIMLNDQTHPNSSLLKEEKEGKQLSGSDSEGQTTQMQQLFNFRSSTPLNPANPPTDATTFQHVNFKVAAANSTTRASRSVTPRSNQPFVLSPPRSNSIKKNLDDAYQSSNSDSASCCTVTEEHELLRIAPPQAQTDENALLVIARPVSPQVNRESCTPAAGLAQAGVAKSDEQEEETEELHSGDEFEELFES